jgi:hypothetical protein
MFKWALVGLILALAFACFGALGIGTRAMELLLIAVCGVVCAASVIAWVYLRKRSPR